MKWGLESELARSAAFAVPKTLPDRPCTRTLQTITVIDMLLSKCCWLLMRMTCLTDFVCLCRSELLLHTQCAHNRAGVDRVPPVAGQELGARVSKMAWNKQYQSAVHRRQDQGAEHSQRTISGPDYWVRKGEEVRKCLQFGHLLTVSAMQLLTCHKQVREVQPKFGLIVCDEAHRLKNLEAKTSQMLNTFCIDRRILLSGTPIQNNLLEFHAMVDVVAPNLLGSQKVFKRVFEEPILKSRMPHASKEALKLGKERSQGLQSITGGLLLRRTAEILANFLPPKYEQVVFCSPTAMQIQIYRAMIQSDRVDEIIRGGVLPSLALAAIGLLRKLCNSPELLLKNVRAEGTEASSSSALLSTIARYLPEQLTNDPGLSGEEVPLWRCSGYSR